jgi:hypothetical protein
VRFLVNYCSVFGWSGTISVAGWMQLRNKGAGSRFQDPQIGLAVGVVSDVEQVDNKSGWQWSYETQGGSRWALRTAKFNVDNKSSCYYDSMKHKVDRDGLFTQPSSTFFRVDNKSSCTMKHKMGSLQKNDRENVELGCAKSPSRSTLCFIGSSVHDWQRTCYFFVGLGFACQQSEAKWFL